MRQSLYLIRMSKWNLSHRPDADWGEDDSSGKAVQPDHYPNIARPGGGYPEGKGHKTDAFCNKCKDQLVDGSCLRCDWGPQNRSVPVKNFPLDPFEDDKAGIRAGKFVPTEHGEPINKDEFGPDDWYYEIDTKYNPPKFWIMYPAQNAGRLITKEELDRKLSEDSGQLSLWNF